MPLLHRLRSSGVKIIVYPNPTRLKKQFHYADKLGIPNVLVVGSEEFEKGQGVLKNMLTGNQKTISLEALDASFFQ
jgi:histidyl-tRNA synthetase